MVGAQLTTEQRVFILQEYDKTSTPFHRVRLQIMPLPIRTVPRYLKFFCTLVHYHWTNRFVKHYLLSLRTKIKYM